MDITQLIVTEINKIVKNLFPTLPAEVRSSLHIQVDPPKDKRMGQLATNVAMILAKPLALPPIEVAQRISQALRQMTVNSFNVAFSNKNASELVHPAEPSSEGEQSNVPRDPKHSLELFFTRVEVVKPGFINLDLSLAVWHKWLALILNEKELFAAPKIERSSLTCVEGLELTPEVKRVNIEYVSANPTGPMHVGHGRGAVIGDVIANLYTFFGKEVTREYYINDAGVQIDVLTRSLYYRYLILCEVEAKVPQDFYPGEYLVDAAKDLKAQVGQDYCTCPEQEALSAMRPYAIDYMLNLIKTDLEALGVKHDIFVSEQSIASQENYDQLKEELMKTGLLYYGTLEQPKSSKAKVNTLENIEGQNIPPALLFRSTKYGDISDRVVEKADKTRTYFANDILYHKDKLARKYDLLIDVLGADHKGYRQRLEAATLALSNGGVNLVTLFTELVNLFKSGSAVRMSKRAGNFVTLRSVLDEISTDAFRIIMLSRNNSSVIDFDLTSVFEKNESNPVFYIQYAYVRINSVLNNAELEFPEFSKQKISLEKLELLTNPAELELIQQLAIVPKTLRTALKTHNAHLVYLLLNTTAKKVHTLYGLGSKDKNLRFICNDNKNLTFARLSLLLATKYIMLCLFNLAGISKPEKM